MNVTIQQSNFTGNAFGEGLCQCARSAVKPATTGPFWHAADALDILRFSHHLLQESQMEVQLTC